jgi:hypothetical protein
MPDEFQRRGLIEAARHGLEGAVSADDNDLTGVRAAGKPSFSGSGSNADL